MAWNGAWEFVGEGDADEVVEGDAEGVVDGE